MQEDALITVAEAASRLGISEDTVKRRIRRGELKGKQIPRPQGYVWLVELLDEAKTTPQHDANHRLNSQEYEAGYQAASQHHDAVSEVSRLEELVAVLQSQVVSQQEELTAKNKQIEQLHVLLQQAQAALPAPKDHRSWWRFWQR